MRKTRGHRVGRLGALGIVAFALVIAFPASALAQIDVGDAVDGVGDKVDETVDQTTDTVDEAVDTVGDTVDGTAGNEGGIVDQTTDTVDRGSEATGQAVDDTVDDTTDVAGDAAKGRIGGVDETLNETVGRVGGVVDSILGRGDGTKAGDGGRYLTGGRSGSGRNGEPIRTPAGGIDGFVPGANPFDTANSAPIAAVRDKLGAATRMRSPIEALIQNVGEVLPKIAFPIALLAAVAAFLVIQGRVDRSDPKLAVAPIDVDQEYLSFR